MTATTTRRAGARRSLSDRLRLWLVGILAAGMALSGSGVAFAAPPSAPAGPAATASVSGTVTDADSGAGIAGATVVALDADGDASAQGTTTSTGGYTITGLAPGSYVVSVSADGYETGATDDVAVAEAAIVTGIDLALVAESPAPGGFMMLAAPPTTYELSGTVLDSEGEPVEGITVYFDGDIEVSTNTGVNGTFSITVSPGTYYAAFVDWRPGDEYPDQYYNASGTAVGFSSQQSPILVEDADVDLELTLLRWGCISGTVTDANGDPIPDTGATVWAVDPDTGTSRGFSSAVEDGEFCIQVFPGTYKVLVEPGGNEFRPTYAPGTRSLDEAEPVTVAEDDVELADIVVGNTISGAILESGAFVPDVYAQSVDTGTWYPGTTTGASYSISGLPNGEYIVRLHTYANGMVYIGYYGGASEAEAIPVRVDGSDATGIDIELFGSGGIAGTVGTDAAIDKSQQVTTVTAYRWNGQEWATVTSASAWGGYLMGASVSGSGYNWFDLTVGEYIVSFTAPGGDPDYPFCEEWFEGSFTKAGASAFTVKYGEVTTGIDVHLTPKTDGCQSKAVRPGAPVITGTAQAGQTLTVDPGSWSPQPVELHYQWAADGTAIDGATGETYVVTAADIGKAITVTVTGTRPGYTSATAASEPTATVAGPNVWTPDQLTPGNTVIVFGSGFTPGEQIRLELHSTPIFLANVTAGANGTFQQTVTIPSSVPPGAHTIVAVRADGTVAATDPVTVVAQAKPQQLAVTGSDGVPWGGLALGGMLLLAGLTFTLLRRRTT